MRKPVHYRVIIVLIAFAVSLLGLSFQLARRVAAENRTWDGGGVTNNWNDAANWSGDTVPTANDQVVFDGTSTKDVTVNVNATMGTLTITNAYTGTISLADGVTMQNALTVIQGGTINVGSGTFATSPNQMSFSGGTINGNTGTLNLNSPVVMSGNATLNGGSCTLVTTYLVLNSGSLSSPSGNWTTQGIILVGGTYDLDNGTITLFGSNSDFSGSGTVLLNNLLINKDDNGEISLANGLKVVQGSLTLTDGLITNGTLRAEGSVNIASTFGNVGGGGSGTVLIQNGSGPRTITLPAGVRLPLLQINDANATINTSGAGTVQTDRITLQAGTVDIGANNLTVGPFTQSGGTFTIGSGNFTMNTGAGLTLSAGIFTAQTGNVSLGIFSAVTLSGGVFNAPSGTTTNGGFTQSGGTFNGNGTLDFNGGLTLSNGIFNASSGNTFLGNALNHSAGTFNHNGGTVIFDSTHPSFGMDVPGTEVFNNVIVNMATPTGEFTMGDDIWDVRGSLQIINGRTNQGIWSAKGDLTVESGADGGTAQVKFEGTGTQTFTNNGGLNTTGAWTINKPSGNLILNSALTLGTSQSLNITSGTVHLNSNSNLTSGALTIGANGRLENGSATTITLGGNVTNSGQIDLQSGAGACPQADTILLRSSSAGTQRTWSGSGQFTINDVNVSDMGGTAPITVFSGTDGGNNGSNWTFINNCPAFVVANTNNSGPGSLRQAVINANDTPGLQTISFNVPHFLNVVSVITIRPRPQLPPITDPVVIDGTTEPGYAGTPLIELYGLRDFAIGTPDETFIDFDCLGLNILAGNSVVKGLAFSNWHMAIRLFENGGNTIQGNHIGLPVPPTPQNYDRNDTGIGLFSDNNLIGGSNPQERNRISNNGTGIDTGDSTGNVIRGNYIGTDTDGVTPMRNAVGIQVGSGTSNLTIGGLQPNEGNTIANNAPVGGIVLYSFWSPTPQGVSIRGNSIYANAYRGIDIGPWGVSTNDGCDADSGANNAQNFPALTGIIPSGANTIIEGILASAAGQSYQLDFYSNATADQSGYGQGKTYLGSATVTTAANCVANFSGANAITLANVTLPAGHVVTATATDANGNTSEFSHFRGVTVADIEGTVLDANSHPLAGAQVRLVGASRGTTQLSLTNRNGRFIFANVQLGDDYTVTLAKSNYTFSPSARTYNNLQAGHNDSYVGDLNTYTISGQVTMDGFALANVVVTAVRGIHQYAVTTDSSGHYSLSNLQSDNYNVTPTKQYHTFNPPSVNVTLAGNRVINFEAPSTQLSALPGRIVFSSGPAIKAMNADGTGLVTIRSVIPDSAEWPSLSHDGSKIAFVRHSSSNGNSLQIMNSDGTDLVTVKNDTDLNSFPGGARWSPDGTKLAFYESASLYTINMDGTNQTFVTSTGATAAANYYPPDWSPDGSKLVFSGFFSNHFEVRTVTTDPSHQIVHLENEALAPKWSPDNASIAFRSGPKILVKSLSSGLSTQVLPGGGIGIPFWSPDSSRIATLKFGSTPELFSVLPDGTDELQMWRPADFSSFDWGVDNTVSNPAGTNVTVGAGSVSITFSTATVGSTTITPIFPPSAGTAPGGFRFLGMAYEMSTTASYTPPITVCFKNPGGPNLTETQFFGIKISHNEGGTLVDRTVSHDFQTRTVCASVNSFSPLVLLEEIDPQLPSITGLVVDPNGDPLSDVLINLSGDEQRLTQTDSEGFFSFDNLLQGGNYTVTPNQIGYLFDFPYQSYVGINGDNTLVFMATATSLTIGGTVRDGNAQPLAGVTLTLSGSELRETSTDVNGRYSISGLPANGSYSVRPSDATRIFSPVAFHAESLQNNLTAVNFTASVGCNLSLAPTSQNFTGAGGANSFTVTASDSACAWPAVSNAPWITINSGTLGTGSGTVNYTVSANTGSPRNGSISVGGETFAVSQSENCVAVSIPNGLTAANGSNLTVPITVGDMSGLGVTSFDFTVMFDSSVLTPAPTPISTSGTLSDGYTITTNANNAGTIVVSGFGANVLTGSGVLLNLQFNMVGSAPACSAITLSSFAFNEGTPCAATTNGQACAINGSISGAVTYANAATTTPVANTNLNLTGATTQGTTTGSDGLYSFTGLNPGAHTVTPAKTGDVNGITSFDAALIAQHVVALTTLSSTQQLAADVSNNGTVTSFDASQIAQYVVAIPNSSITGSWRFVPPSRAYASVAANQPNQNFAAVLMGEVSGNWTPPIPGPVVQPETNVVNSPVPVSLANIIANTGASVTVPLITTDLSGLGVVAYQCDVAFNPNVVQPQPEPTETANTLSNGMLVTVNSATAGLLKISVFGANPSVGGGTLLKLKFSVVGNAGSSTQLTISNFLFNEGNPANVTNAGSISVAPGPTAADGNISGTIVDATGHPVEGAAVRLTGTQNRLTVTDAEGRYRFDNVETNGFYTVTPARANFNFTPAQRSFSQLGVHTEATFTGAASGGALNPLDSTEYFVRQQYVDFLSREPDEAGLNFWYQNIESCGPDQTCREVKRIDTSAAFFLSIEFQQTGYLVARTYQVAYGNLPQARVPLTRGEFVPDTRAIGSGVIVRQSGWAEKLEQNQQLFMTEFVQRARFASAYPVTLTPAEYVDRLFINAGFRAAERDRAAAINEFGGATTSADVAARARALRRVAENSTLQEREFSQAFVMMQYFGYLRRDPNVLPDTDFSGYNFWLTKLERFNGNYLDAEMVKAFITTIEYRQRFGRP